MPYAWIAGFINASDVRFHIPLPLRTTMLVPPREARTCHDRM